MATKNLETPRESELNDFMNEEATLKSEISRNADPSIDGIDIGILERKKIDAKKPSESEISSLRKAGVVEGTKVMMSKLVQKHFELNDSVSSDEEWKELQKNPKYITIVQATLNIMNKPCKISGVYDAQTQISLREFVKERTGKEKVLDKDGYLLFGYKNVLANALASPSKTLGKEYTNYSSLPYFDREWRLEQTYWDLEDEDGAIRIPKKCLITGNKYKYPAWTQANIIENDDEE